MLIVFFGWFWFVSLDESWSVSARVLVLDIDVVASTDSGASQGNGNPSNEVLTMYCGFFVLLLLLVVRNLVF